METLSIVKGLDEAKYFIIEYIYVPLLLPRKLDISKLILVKIIVDIYLIDNLRANILIGIDTIGPKGINIIIIKRYTYIISCSMRIPIKIKL